MKTRTVLGAVLLLTAAVYFNALRAPFIFDDIGNIRMNPAVESFSAALKAIPRTPLMAPRPVTFLSFTLNHELGGLDPLGYRLFNLAVHLANVLLVFFLSARVFRNLLDEDPGPWAALAAAFFAVHPVNTEAVTYIYNRSDGLATLFYLLGLLLYARGTEGGRTDARWIAGSCASYVLGLLSKEIAITLPFALMLYDYFVRTDRDGAEVRGRRKLYAGYLAIGLAYFLARRALSHHAFDTMPDTYRLWNPVSYAFAQFYVLARYLQLWIVPAGQCIDHRITLKFLTAGRLLAAAAVWTAAYLLLKLWARKGASVRLLGFAGGFALAALAPTSSVFPIADAMAERRMYLPGWGLALLLAALYAFLLRRRPGDRWKKGILAAAVAHVLLLSEAAAWRNALYTDPAKMWQQAIKRYPADARAYNNLGTVYMERNDYASAYPVLRQAVRLVPRWKEANLNLGLTAYQLGLSTASEQAYLAVVAQDQQSLTAWTNLGTVYYDRRDYQRAFQCYRNSLALNPDNNLLQKRVGFLYLMLGKPEEARAHFGKCLELDPRQADVLCFIGNTYGEKEAARAAEYYRKAIEAAPSFPDAHANLGMRLAALGKRKEAAKELRKAVELYGGKGPGAERARQVLKAVSGG